MTTRQGLMLADWAFTAVVGGTFGIFALGIINSATYSYTYSGGTVAAGTALTSIMNNSGVAAGNATLGIFALGNSDGVTNSYTYSGGTVAAGTYLGAVVGRGAPTPTPTLAARLLLERR